MELELTQGCVTLIDDEDWDLVSTHRWRAKARGSGFQAATRLPGSVTLLLHALLLEAPTGYTVDHINRDPMDNRRGNLRLATPQQQALNTRNRVTSNIPYKGVSATTGANTYRARFLSNEGRVHIGCFKTPEEAAYAYDRAVLDYWSKVPDDPISGSYTQFLYLNFPEEDYAIS